MKIVRFFFLLLSIAFVIDSDLSAIDTAYVANVYSGTIDVIDLSTETVTQSIDLGYPPLDIVFSPDGTKAYVTGSGSTSIDLIDTATHTVTTSIETGTPLQQLAISPDGSTLYAPSSRLDQVHIINTTTNTVTTSVSVAGAPAAVAVTPDNTKAFIACSMTNNVVALDTSSNALIPGIDISVGEDPTDIIIDPVTGAKAYVCNHYADTVSVIDIILNVPITTISVNACPNYLAITPDGSTVYALVINNQEVHVINTATNTTTAIISVEDQPIGASVSSDGAKLYITKFTAITDNIAVIDTATNLTIDGITTGSGQGSRVIAITIIP